MNGRAPSTDHSSTPHASKLRAGLQCRGPRNGLRRGRVAAVGKRNFRRGRTPGLQGRQGRPAFRPFATDPDGRRASDLNPLASRAPRNRGTANGSFRQPIPEHLLDRPGAILGEMMKLQAADGLVEGCAPVR